MAVLAGSINHKIFGGNNNAANEVFTSLFNFLTSSYATQMGVQLVAYNIGSNGTGVGYWDEATHFGQNAWATFGFMSASVPFYLHIQYSSPGAYYFGSSPGNPALAQNRNDFSGMAWCVTQRIDGSNPWNGTTASNGADTKGTPVWTSGTSGIFTIPRSNSPGGAHATNRENMVSCLDGQGGFYTGASFYGGDFRNWFSRGTMAHFLIDQNNFCMVYDYGFTKNHTVHWWGKYRPSANNPYPCTYAGIGTFLFEGLPVYPPSSWSNFSHGNPSGTGNQGGFGSGLEGGIGVMSGSFTGSVAFSVDVCWSGQLSSLAPNLLISGTAQNDIYTVMLIANETPFYGFLGSIDFYGFTNNRSPGSTSQDKKWAQMSIGIHGDAGQNYYCEGGWVVPWDGATVPGSSTDRRGIQFIR